jgi:hypothetical protein
VIKVQIKSIYKSVTMKIQMTCPEIHQINLIQLNIREKAANQLHQVQIRIRVHNKSRKFLEREVTPKDQHYQKHLLNKKVLKVRTGKNPPMTKK